jgi:AbrB family looped-hinge helix DNA binding protein
MILCMARTTLRARGQLTLPEEIRVAARLEEGDLLDAEITPDGILLRPRKVIDATQAWFWDSAWQEGEQAADADRSDGKVEAFASGDELLDALKAIAKPVRPRRTR